VCTLSALERANRAYAPTASARKAIENTMGGPDRKMWIHIASDTSAGGWLTAVSGKGTTSYFAYAFHRQLPYGVPGAYRLLANLLSLGK
jgi:hypothetical protein